MVSEKKLLTFIEPELEVRLVFFCSSLFFVFDVTIIYTERQKEKVHHENEKKEKPKEISSDNKKVGRNEKCPCGSGKKYKHCCGAL